jgi:hypothetical protein
MSRARSPQREARRVTRVVAAPDRGLGRRPRIARSALFGRASERHLPLGDVHVRLMRMQGDEVC